MKATLTALLMLLAIVTNAQKNKTYFPAWTYHQKNVNIYGISAGVSDLLWENGNTKTYGIRLSAIGEGIFAFMIPHSPVIDFDDTANTAINRDNTMLEHINGINLSTSGTMCRCNINGVSVGFLGHVADTINGISIVLFQNYAQIHTGIQFAVMSEAYKMHGVQVGGMNKNFHTKGLQIGVYNKNKHTKGVQLGGVNKSRDTKGIQIGLWNTNERRKLPLINWNFRTADA